MPPCNTYHLTWVSLTVDVGYLLQALLLTLDEGYLLTAAPPDLDVELRGVAPFSPPVPVNFQSIVSHFFT